jgi:hypothetical protein
LSDLPPLFPPSAPPPPPPPSYAPGALVLGPPTGPIGRQRSTGLSMLLFVVTFGIYGYVWIFQVHEEMKIHGNDGLGGVVPLVLWFFTGTLVMGFLTPLELEKFYQRQGRESPVSWTVGLWSSVGLLLCGLGPIVWFVLVNRAINDYWRALGAPNP